MFLYAFVSHVYVIEFTHKQASPFQNAENGGHRGLTKGWQRGACAHAHVFPKRRSKDVLTLAVFPKDVDPLKEIIGI